MSNDFSCLFKSFEQIVLQLKRILIHNSKKINSYTNLICIQYLKISLLQSKFFENDINNRWTVLWTKIN